MPFIRSTKERPLTVPEERSLYREAGASKTISHKATVFPFTRRLLLNIAMPVRTQQRYWKRVFGEAYPYLRQQRSSRPASFIHSERSDQYEVLNTSIERLLFSTTGCSTTRSSISQTGAMFKSLVSSFQPDVIL